MSEEKPRWGYLGFEEDEIPGTKPDLPTIRDEAGKFRRGDYYATKANRLARLRDAAIDAVSFADLQAIMRKQVELATAGDKTAAAFVFDSPFGKRPQVKLSKPGPTCTMCHEWQVAGMPLRTVCRPNSVQRPGCGIGGYFKR